MQSTWQRKPWGSTEVLFLDKHTQVSRICMVENGYSSCHKHETKANIFTVLRGHLIVSTYVEREDGTLWEVGSHTLSPGQSYTVLPGIWHRFHALTCGEAIESYYAPDGSEVSLDDITRFDSNGVGRPPNQEGRCARPNDATRAG